MVFSLTVAATIIAVCSGSTCNVYQANEKALAIPQSYVCCNNTKAANSACNVKVYSTGENGFHCSADGIGKEGQKHQASFECGSCLKQQKCDEFSQNLEHSSRNRVKVFKTCCASYRDVVEEEKFSMVRKETNLSSCGDGICGEDETPCNCTADCDDDGEKTTKCPTGGSALTYNEIIEIIIGVCLGVGILILLCFFGAAMCAFCFQWLAKVKEPADMQMYIKRLEL